MITLQSKRYSIAAYGTTLDSRYPQGGYASLLSEGFESGTVGVGYSGWNARSTYDNTRTSSGAKSLKVQMLNGSTAFGGRPANSLPVAVTEGHSVWLSARLYFPSTFSFGYGTSGDGNGWSKFLVLAPNSGSSRIYVQIPAASSSAVQPLNGTRLLSDVIGGDTTLNVTQATPTIPVDEWFTLQIQVFVSSTISGYARWWLNDTFVGEDTGKKTVASAGMTMTEWGIGDYWNGQWYQGGGTDSFWVDDVIIATDMAGYGEPTGRDSLGNPFIDPTSRVSDTNVTLTGSGFGTKATAAPYYFDTFDSQTVGALDTDIGWTATDAILNGASRPSVQNDVVYGGAGKSLRMVYPVSTGAGGNCFPKSILTLPASTTKARFSCHFRYERTVKGSSVLPILKLSRGGSDPVYSGNPKYFMTIRPDTNDADNFTSDIGYTTASGSTSLNSSGGSYTPTNPAGGGGNLTQETWHFIEYEYVLSTPDTADGLYVQRVNGKEGSSISRTATTRVAADSAKYINYVMSVFDGNDTYGLDNEWTLWMDNALIDTSFARVIATDNATFASSTKFADQPCATWSDTAITITAANYAGFTSGAAVHFHVFDEDGTEVDSFERMVP